MKLQNTLLIVVLLTGITLNLQAQTDSTTIDSSLQKQMTEVDSVSVINKVATIKQRIPHNLIKINLAALLFKSYSLQYERVLNRKFSVAIQYRTMPATGIPFKSTIFKYMGDEDPDTKKIIEDFRLSNYAVTAEARLYLSRKGYGRGFYLAPFYRYASFTSNNFSVFYSGEEEKSIKLLGNLTSNTYGLAIGAQNALGKHLVLDWSLLGPHYGSAKGNFSGNSLTPLSPEDQDDLRDHLENIDIPLTNKTINVDANGASLIIDGPWAGIRFTIGLGFRF